MAFEPLQCRIVGLGGAGINVLDRLAHDGARHEDLVAINTDLQSLTGSVAGKKIQLGKRVTRGLGAGGDPELGYAAAEEALEEIREAIGDAGVVFLCMGLGGGTGSGAAPVIVQAAREAGAFVVVFATMPFQFEGRRRMQQAEEALAAVQQRAHAVICFENDRMGEALSPQAGIHEAFSNADRTVSESLLAMIGMVNRESLIQLGFDEVLSVLKKPDARCLYGYGIADTEDRAREALDAALRNPLMDRGRLLSESTSLIVQVTGGASMTLYEVQMLMEDIGRLAGDKTQILFGLGVDPQMGDQLSVMLFSSVSPWRTTAPTTAEENAPARIPPPQRPAIIRPAITTQAGSATRGTYSASVDVREEPAEGVAPVLQSRRDARDEEMEATHRKPTFVSLAAGQKQRSQTEQNDSLTAQESGQQQPMSTLARITQRVQASMGIIRPAPKTETESGAAKAPAAAAPRRYFPQKSNREREPLPSGVSRDNEEKGGGEGGAAQATDATYPATEDSNRRDHAEVSTGENPGDPIRHRETAARKALTATVETQDAQKRPTETREETDARTNETSRRDQEPFVRQRVSQEEDPGLPVRSTRIMPVRPQVRVVGPQKPNVGTSSNEAPKQEMLQFDPVNRGRFEKSEPTIVDGEDLDVPTFMRQNPKS